MNALKSVDLRQGNGLCLLIHCLKKKSDPPPPFHSNLFIPLEALELLVQQLLESGYQFTLPGVLLQSNRPQCSITFDDGYYNNHLFLPLAEKYRIPFLVFPNSYNIQNNMPFIWDLWKSKKSEEWPFTSVDYKGLYEDVLPEERKQLLNDQYRPFTFDELKKLAQNRFVRLGAHGHTHQPFVDAYASQFHQEIDQNLNFLGTVTDSPIEDFAFPCGLYTPHAMRQAQQEFKRVYTISGGPWHLNQKVVHRISLENSDERGTLEQQIIRSLVWWNQLKKRINMMAYTQPGLKPLIHAAKAIKSRF
ncbi:MAG: hypothetical protein COV74_09735 [Candidatus Omnitrophica bacterium CG11_big_fil_rev_8_21_14_0_20_45_26]|uniref:NodB homology domain-containing protein n=1 Tax=Candidatus Abzuiibacterium crystallinum TaxID=1974748 RepID=A0A2H0LLE0_9BACT|nr:MAG: hypothetical protein COV74_09735 [Candidatus Omnitrophica bacterium CG11_big_fil_rev_8_21_14_0_20_45_26]PIW64489.1 MAG: hypothetical protein COW12_05860 [Candidatus Omnitrophica bacterium CG12_big_fil_rev_8_21_14_0_65_45_16]